MASRCVRESQERPLESPRWEDLLRIKERISLIRTRRMINGTER
jgi:hypothetical protein